MHRLFFRCFSRVFASLQVIGLIASFTEQVGHEAAAERIAHVLDHYQEQPSIIDSQLEAMVTPLLAAVRLVAHGGQPQAVLPHACHITTDRI